MFYMEVTATQAEISPLQSRLNQLESLRDYVVNDPESFAYAVNSIRDGKLAIKEVEAEEDPKIAKVRAPYQAALDVKSHKIKTITALIGILDKQASTWRDQEKKRLLDEYEAKKKALIAAKEASFDIFEPAPIVTTIALPPPEVRIPDGSSYRNSKLIPRWIETEEDRYAGKRTFIRECLNNPSLLDYFDFVPVMVEAKIKLHQEKVGEFVPGIEIYRKQIHTIKG